MIQLVDSPNNLLMDTMVKILVDIFGIEITFVDIPVIILVVILAVMIFMGLQDLDIAEVTNYRMLMGIEDIVEVIHFREKYVRGIGHAWNVEMLTSQIERIAT